MTKIKTSENLSFSPENEINFKFIFNFLNRNKALISTISISAFVFSIVISFLVKKTWEGKFQIVLNPEDKKSKLAEFGPNIQDLIGNSATNNLKTEVGILESPSLLMPIYEFVLSQKNIPSKKFSFSNWERNLDINLEKGTSILNISYRDKDKKIILPVLEKMTLTYQDYSGRNKKRSQQLTKKYLQNQIILFKEKSLNSLKLVQDYATKQELNYLNMSIKESEINDSQKINQLGRSSYSFFPNIEIENVRVRSANEIKRIDLKIDKIRKFGDDILKLKYISSTIPALVEEGLPSELAQLEREILEMRSKYTELDPAIIRKIKERDLFIKFLKERSISFLQAQRVEAEATMQSVMRPKGVLLKYKKLLREAARDESNLILLENQLTALKLEEAKLEDPWELITVPTLLTNPVGPSKKIISLVGLFAGFILVSGYLLYKENKSGIIFDDLIFEETLEYNFIQKISLKELEEDSQEIRDVKNFISYKSKDPINLIFLGNFIDETILKLKHFLTNKENTSVITIKSLENLKNHKNSKNILLVRKGFTKYSEIDSLKKYLGIFQIDLSGIILFS